jgi:hypothetical protein
MLLRIVVVPLMRSHCDAPSDNRKSSGARQPRVRFFAVFYQRKLFSFFIICHAIIFTVTKNDVND